MRYQIYGLTYVPFTTQWNDLSMWAMHAYWQVIHRDIHTCKIQKFSTIISCITLNPTAECNILLQNNWEAVTRFLQGPDPYFQGPNYHPQGLFYRLMPNLFNLLMRKSMWTCSSNIIFCSIQCLIFISEINFRRRTRHLVKFQIKGS